MGLHTGTQTVGVVLDGLAPSNTGTAGSGLTDFRGSRTEPYFQSLESHKSTPLLGKEKHHGY